MRSAHVESERVYGELVSALFTAMVPLLIMTATYLLVGSYIYTRTKAPVVLAALIVGMIASVCKLSLHVWFRRSVAGVRLSSLTASVWDRRFAIAHLSFAAALGSLLSATFSLSELGSQLLATGVLFGFCSGQVARVAVRARLCAISIFVAAVPCALAAALHHNTPYLILAGLFTVFAVGSIESVRYAHRQATDRIALNHELEIVASLDPLTGLLNRFGLRREIAVQWGDPKSRAMVAVHYFDLDGFKRLNDRHGHAAGDALLRELAKRVTACLQPGDIAARLGGDEFVIIQTTLHHADEAELFARRICRAVTSPYLAPEEVSVGVSIGTCAGQSGSDSFDDMLGVADARMYAIKQAGGGVHTASAARRT